MSRKLFQSLFSAKNKILYLPDFKDPKRQLLSGRLLYDSEQPFVAFSPEERLFGANPAFCRLTGYRERQLHTMKLFDIAAAAGRDIFKQKIGLLKRTGQAQRIALQCVRASGNLLQLEFLLHVTQSGEGQFFYAFVQDVTEQKKNDDYLQYLISHDPLTGLYSRSCFADRMRAIRGGGHPGIIMCDIDGLKSVNQREGIGQGDILLRAAADILAKNVRPGDLVARLSGDEFGILLPDIDRQGIEAYCHRICEAVLLYNKAEPHSPLSLSLGYAVAAAASVSLDEVLKKAENRMLREKLNHDRSERSSMVRGMMKMLEARDFITEGHALRIRKLLDGLAREVGCSDSELDDLSLLAQFHDIGKIGIPDRVLLKKGPLTPEELSVMRQHSAIGQHIAATISDLSGIADWILKHHEWWNGQGYPLGLAGEDIPLECRLLAIVDAYDAMTNDRPYGSPLSHQAAISEIVAAAGTQFDPDLVERFVIMTLDDDTQQAGEEQ
jgi:diguanylate cyclase (GGDEF)-like protein/PAS domain S-box-containing protein